MDGSTKELARQLGFIRQRSSNYRPETRKVCGQNFEFLLVIDFESTCWEDKKFRTNEIIEFPAVLLDGRKGEIVREFQQYVMPMENPVLSEFCTKLTGITQSQVEDGVPLATCLTRFNRWLSELTCTYDCSWTSSNQKRAAVITWSDWDLGVCLLNECRRKQLRFPAELSSWIDLRATYRTFYNRRPQGLQGALSDCGIKFTGRQHSGLDDSRNTAMLAWRMMQDGCRLQITKSIPTDRTVKTSKECDGQVTLTQLVRRRSLATEETPITSTPRSSRNTNFKDLNNRPISICEEAANQKSVVQQNLTFKKPAACNKPREITPPMCNCGRRATKKQVQMPGPNFSRFFFSCPLRQRFNKSRGCEMFVWADNYQPAVTRVRQIHSALPVQRKPVEEARRATEPANPRVAEYSLLASPDLPGFKHAPPEITASPVTVSQRLDFWDDAISTPVLNRCKTTTNTENTGCKFSLPSADFMENFSLDNSILDNSLSPVQKSTRLETSEPNRSTETKPLSLRNDENKDPLQKQSDKDLVLRDAPILNRDMNSEVCGSDDGVTTTIHNTKPVKCALGDITNYTSSKPTLRSKLTRVRNGFGLLTSFSDSTAKNSVENQPKRRKTLGVRRLNSR